MSERHVRLRLLAARLNERSAYTAAFQPDGPAVLVRLVERPEIRDLVVCRPREGHGRWLWFFTSWGRPISRASDLAAAVDEIGRYLMTRP